MNKGVAVGGKYDGRVLVSFSSILRLIDPSHRPSTIVDAKNMGKILQTIENIPSDTYTFRTLKFPEGDFTFWALQNVPTCIAVVNAFNKTIVDPSPFYG